MGVTHTSPEQLQALLRQRDRMAQMLRRLEWSDRDWFYPSMRTCPVCCNFGFTTPNPHLVDPSVLKGVHKPHCALATLLKDLA